MIPDNLQIFGENMFGVHSIEYDKLDSYFYIFGVLEDGCTWLSWDRVKELADMLGIPTVPEVVRKQVSIVNAINNQIILIKFIIIDNRNIIGSLLYFSYPSLMAKID